MGLFLVFRFGLGGSEDTWICQDGIWVKHGNPSQPQPVIPCEKNGQSIEDIKPTGVANPITYEESKIIAEEYAKDTSTFKFDGSNLKLDSTESLPCPYCWQFNFSFVSSHAGWGDRKGLVLAQVITPHKLLVSMKEGEVTAMVVDQTYDEINLKYIK